MIGCLSSFFFYTLLAGYMLATFGYVFAISESLSLERTDDVFLLENAAYPEPIGPGEEPPLPE